MDPLVTLVATTVFLIVGAGLIALALYGGQSRVLRSVRSRFPDRVTFAAVQSPDPQPDLEALTGWSGELPPFVLSFSREGMTLWRDRAAPVVDLPWSRIDAVDVVDFRADDGRSSSALRLAIRLGDKTGTVTFTTPGSTGQFWRTPAQAARVQELADRIQSLR